MNTDDGVPTLVSTQWLADHCRPSSTATNDASSVQIVDGSWYLPAQARNARDEYRSRHIPGAVFFDIDAISDSTSALPHMLPTAEAFGTAMAGLGLSNRQHIVVYDGAGLFSAARVWWTFRAFGVETVSVLDGGLPAWLAEGRPVESGDVFTKPVVFDARVVAGVATADDVAAALDGPAQVVDARPAGRFHGREPEPRPGLRSGHMPNAVNLPSSNLIENGRLKEPGDLRAVIEAAGIDLDKPIITSCGSGVTAAVLALALARLGAPEPKLYDGSWAEWGGDPARPVVTVTSDPRGR